MSFQFKKNCFFDYDKLLFIDYKDPKLCDFVSDQVWKIIPRRFTKIKACYQKKLSKEIKKARYIALLPYCSTHKKEDVF